ncbi:MAG: alpha/beta fold hydrolase [Candidatus Binatia bacterium]
MEYIQRLIRVPLNHDNEKEGEFDLYYFIHKPVGSLQVGLKTVLFCAGGPGQIVRPRDENLLKFLRDENTAYRIVHFHLRGSGFSQIPPDRESDRFIRTSQAVRDIEKIRLAVLKDQPWDGIVGYSYGTVLAQQYTSEYKQMVRKLILIGPLSMHKFKSPKPAEVRAAFDAYAKKVQKVRQNVIGKIYEKNEEFKDKVSKTDITEIKTRLAEVFDRIEERFGSEKFVADKYSEFLDSGKLKDADLEQYSQLFFKKLCELRFIGWQPTEIEGLRAKQVEAARVIALGLDPSLKDKLGTVEPKNDSADDPVDESYRTLYVMWAYDGFRPRFLKELSESNQDIGAALKRGAERVGGNEFIEKIGISNVKPTVWDPAKYKHDVPTLILEGDADPVTADGQAEHYLEQALTGARTFIKFAGVGHGFDLPQIDIMQPYLIGSVLINPKTVKKGESNLKLSGLIPSVARIIDSGGSEDDRVAAIRSGSNLEFQDAIILSKNEVSVRVINGSAQEQDTEGIHLNIKHNLFTAKVTLKGSRVPRKGKSWVSGTFKIIDQNYVLRPPANLEDGLELIEGSVRLVLPGKVSLKIKNTADHDVPAKPKNWIYKPTGTTFKGPCQGEGLPSRNCLIYAFLEMEHEDFRKQKSEFLELGGIRQYIRTIDHRPGQDSEQIQSSSEISGEVPENVS